MRVEAIWRYPVKSMGGERVSGCAVGREGLEGDRAFAVVDPSDGTVASAKHPRKWGLLLQFQAAFVDGPDGPVRITFPDGSTATSDDPDVDRRLSDVLGRDVTLTRTVPDQPAYEAEWPDVDGVIPADFLAAVQTGPGPEGGTLSVLETRRKTFLDLAAVHVVASSTLAHLADLAPGSVFDQRRFRPNVVVDGAGGDFVENGWTASPISIGAEVVLRPLVPTMRCVMTTLAQPGLPQDRGTLQAVATHNRLDLPGFGVWSCVGLYADVETSGAIGVDDVFSVS
jgi:hypothetical protein